MEFLASWIRGPNIIPKIAYMKNEAASTSISVMKAFEESS